MNQPSIQPYESSPSLYADAADSFCELVSSIASTGKPVRVSLSGGSTPRRLYEMLAQRELPWSQIHWFWGDERNVPHDHDDSNYRMVREALLDPVAAPAENVHPVPVNVDDPVGTAQRYEQILREHFPGDEFPSWELTLLGMGDDAHTASLFPETSALQESERWFVENRVDKLDSVRYTMSAPAINSAGQSWFLVTGSGKRQALTNVLSSDRKPQLYPSQLITPTRWFVTADAYPES